MSKACDTSRGLQEAFSFEQRHLGPSGDEIKKMLSALGVDGIEALIEQTIPSAIRTDRPLHVGEPLSEHEAVSTLRRLASDNVVMRSMIGMGYSETITPPAIQRGILENPGWYTAYTAYQPEISQGRLEALLNFQTMVTDLTAMEVANASLLDEATAAAEAMTLCRRARRRSSGASRFVVSAGCHPQTLDVVRGRAGSLGIDVHVSDDLAELDDSVFGVLVQVPTTDGRLHSLDEICEKAHEVGALVVVATDLLALTLIKPPGEYGADVVIGSTQRFGVPLGFGGPHAAFMATKQAYARQMPGRLVGVSKDSTDQPALRLALQTREQHIRRDKATSNICTAQVLLAVMASMYAVHHGPDGLRAIAQRIHQLTNLLARWLERSGETLASGAYFDTLRLTPSDGAERVLKRAVESGVNLRRYDNGDVGINLGETVSMVDIESLVRIVTGKDPGPAPDVDSVDLGSLARTSTYLEHPVFHRYRSETELMRYMHRLETRDLSLNTSMIPLGSCTMKLNAAAEMLTITEPGFANLHPAAPEDQTRGYAQLIETLGAWLCDVTGFSGVSFMPNAGAQGEYAGLEVIRAYQQARGQGQRDVCLIPQSAHGTNPASAVLAGLRVVVVGCDERGDIDLADLRGKIDKHKDELCALMVTYPSTHGVFETSIKEICAMVHEAGGQVYLDGANMNAMVGLCRPAELGADVCHLNLHKTFCIPHGGGGPGMGPICVADQLVPHLPRHPGQEGDGIAPISQAAYGSPSILPIPYAYIAMMGSGGLKRASEIAILNANYIAARLADFYPILFTGEKGRVAHECILDVRVFKDSAGIEVDDIAKRLMDYGFHAPTMSWPVAGTLMIEPTESESKEELDRFCDAMISIREEIRKVERGEFDRDDNPLKNAPHPARVVTADEWTHAYSRQTAAYPAPWTREAKFWPSVARVDQAYGDRHLVCSCPPLEAYEEA